MAANSTTQTDQTAYFETIVCTDKSDGSADWHYICNLCSRRLDDGPCPDHAPTDIPGLRLVECDAEPRHPSVWFVDGDYYEPPCMYCISADQAKRIDYFQRCRHWAWRRTRLFSRITGRAYALGIIGGSGSSYGNGEYAHHGCTYGLRWRGKRNYILGWPTWKWSCLLKQRHWPAEFVGLNSCSKCFPCPDCGATRGCHYGCENKPKVST